MKFKKWHKGLVIMLCILFGYLAYLNSNYYIQKQQWKYRDGFHLGDWIDFEGNGFELKDNNIYFTEKKLAKIIICVGKLLIIASPDKKEFGYYINK